MSKNSNSNNNEKEEFKINSENNEYNNLITTLKEIKATIALLEKTILN